MRFLLSVLVLCGATYAGWHYYPQFSGQVDPVLAHVKSALNGTGSKHGSSSAESRTGGALVDNSAGAAASSSSPLSAPRPGAPVQKPVSHPALANTAPLANAGSTQGEASVPATTDPETLTPAAPATPVADSGTTSTPVAPSPTPAFGEPVAAPEPAPAALPPVNFTTTAELYVTAPDQKTKVTIPAGSKLPVLEIREDNVVIGPNELFEYKALLPRNFFKNAKGDAPDALNIIPAAPREISLLGEASVKQAVINSLKGDKVKAIPYKTLKGFRYLGKSEFGGDPCEAAEVDYEIESIFGVTPLSARAIFIDGQLKGWFVPNSSEPLK